ncbi:MAG: site-2 protease family protein [Planctomycetota bacterium]
MLRSYPLFRAFGIPVRVHGTLLICLPLLAFSMTGDAGFAYFAIAVGLMVSMFACVLLHELGHSVAALALGFPVQSITLTPIGGVAALTAMPRNPWHELLITIAGPAVNFVLAAIFFVANGLWANVFFSWLVVMNLVLGIFNLLPGFPMDGGRILRALLALKLPYVRATRIAATVGQITAFGLGAFGLVEGRIMLVLIAVFVYFAAGAELRRVTAPPDPIGDQLRRWLAAQQRMGGTHGSHEPVPPRADRPAGNSKVVLEVWPNGEIRRRP